MAPELRARKQTATPTGKTGTKTKAAAPKRKAVDDDASPVAAKKAKPLKSNGTTKKTSKSTKKAQIVAEPASDDENDASIPEEENDVALALAGVSDSEDGDEEVDDSVAFKQGDDVGIAPKPTKAIETAAKSGKPETEGTGVVYIGRIPHGFYEHEMKAYFSQFGDIKKLRLSRNKKTGQSKHYAFVEFAEESTAEIVAKTMNNYLMFGHLLKCRLLPQSQVHADLFKGANKRYKSIPRNRMAGTNLKKPLSEDQWANKISRTNEKRAEKAKKLKELGYDFEAPELKTAVAPKDASVAEITEAEAPKAIEAPPAADDNAAETEAVGELEDSARISRGGLSGKRQSKSSKQETDNVGKKAKKPTKSKKSKA